MRANWHTSSAPTTRGAPARTLYAWGTLPHLVQAEAVTVRIRLERSRQAVVYAISTSGKRPERVAAKAEGGELVVPLNLVGPDGKARLAYEVVAE